MFQARLTRSFAPRFQEILRSGSPVWWTSGWSRLWIRSGPPTSPPYRCRSISSTWWRSWICFPETCSAGSSPTALTRSPASMPWRWHWQVVATQRSSIPIRAANSRIPTSCRKCRQRRSRSAGQAENVATTTSWWRGCGAHSSMRRCIYVPTEMAGRLKSAWLDYPVGPAI